MFDPFFFLHLSEAPLILFPVFVLATVALLMVPALLHSPAHPTHAARAVLCYLMQGVGLMLLAVSALHVLPFLFAGHMVTPQAFATPLLLFVTGVWLLIHFSKGTHALDPHAVEVPRAIFYVSFEIVGIALIITSGLYLTLSALSGNLIDRNGLIAIHWELPLTLLLLGTLLAIACSHALPVKKSTQKKGILGSVRRKKKA